MHLHSVDLKEFYDDICGRIVQRVLRRYLRKLWPDARGMRMLGVGFATPYLKIFMGEAERIAALMPSSHGAVPWPPDDKGLVALYEEDSFPVETNSTDRIVAIHAAETIDGLDRMLAECWRVLAGQGRLILVVPNRSGLWARSDHTPFGCGVPYSQKQIRELLKAHMFVPESIDRALFFPPTSSSRFVLTTAPLIEKIGQSFFNAFGGVYVIEASKQIYAGTPVGVTQREAAFASRRRRLASSGSTS